MFIVEAFLFMSKSKKSHAEQGVDEDIHELVFDCHGRSDRDRRRRRRWSRFSGDLHPGRQAASQQQVESPSSGVAVLENLAAQLLVTSGVLIGG
jgi:hypothetical protein